MGLNWVLLATTFRSCLLSWEGNNDTTYFIEWTF
jgi:hypothetical protein